MVDLVRAAGYQPGGRSKFGDPLSAGPAGHRRRFGHAAVGLGLSIGAADCNTFDTDFAVHAGVGDSHALGTGAQIGRGRLDIGPPIYAAAGQHRGADAKT